MKSTVVLLLIFCFASKLPVFGQTLVEENLRKKESMEIAYITDCRKMNRRIDSLIEWKLSSEHESFISYKYKRDRLVFFELHKDSQGTFLHSIDYYHRSFQKLIFLNDTLSKYEINSQTRFRVWMSKDKLSVYFCMINPDNITMWVLTNGNTVYTSRSSLVRLDTNQDDKIQ